MVSFKATLLAATSVVGALATPTEMLPRHPGPRSYRDIMARSTPNSQGTSGGYFYQFWSEGGGSVTYTNGNGGEYSVQWSNVDDFTSGKGWSSAASRDITFTGTFNPGANGYLAVYTWSGSGETYILENFGSYNPGSGGQHIGTLTSDGGTYDVYKVERSATYIQYWSIRQSKRSSGTVTTGNHYNYYNAHNLPFNPSTNATYQIVSVEGFSSSGNADITVGLASSSSPPPPPPPPPASSTHASPPPSSTTGSSPPPPPPSSGGSCSAQWGQCGGLGWSGPQCCNSGFTCKEQNPYYSQCL